MEIRLLKDKVLIKQHERDEVTKGGIVLPDNKELRPDPVGVVIALGTETKEVQVGDEVIFGSYAGTMIMWDDAECLILREADVLAVIS